MSDLERLIRVLKNEKAEYRLIMIRSVPCTVIRLKHYHYATDIKVYIPQN